MSVKPLTCRLPYFLVKPEKDATTALANCELRVNGIPTSLEEALGSTAF
jgi:hypothetical protein